ncbi:amidohydrolase [Neobacillus mesonae]|uniref:amidohydrolase n=1 Tax=Neobacillus mesonae TaxID=1193713 RepID=UPI00203B45A8|nr:amidohydrolase [Neobacillus mesonae]MCM3570395.1 amidohydrolase [Neobacillus mesonae]
MKVDLLLKNANVLTLDQENRCAGCVAVAKGKIVGIWVTEEPPKGAIEISSQTNVVDLHGASLLPGFIDTHNHILMYGQTMSMVNCCSPSPNQTIKGVLEGIAAKVQETKNGEWVQGYGYDDTLINEKRHITREDLDQVSSNTPVFITHVSGHVAYVNSLALKMAGLTDGISNPNGGQYGKDEKGRLNGVLYEESAMAPVRRKIPQMTVEDKIHAISTASKEYVAQGITTITDAAVFGLDDLEAHLQASKFGVNPMRTRLMIMHHLLRKGAPYGDYSQEQLNKEIMMRSGGRAKLDSAKIFQYGLIQGLPEALSKSYYNNPVTINHSQDSFNEEVLDLHRRGFRMAAHGNGDRAVGSILEAYENALLPYPRAKHLHRIDHVQTASTAVIKKMAELGVAGSFSINHVYLCGERHKQIFLIPERGNRISPLAEAVKHNLLFTLHSDCPITSISPIFSVWLAVNRMTRDGDILGPEQRIDLVTALKSMTIYGAELNFDEKITGSIEIGRQADFVVLEADPTAVNPMDIKDIKIQATFIEGKPVYVKDTVRTI